MHTPHNSTMKRIHDEFRYKLNSFSGFTKKPVNLEQAILQIVSENNSEITNVDIVILLEPYYQRYIVYGTIDRMISTNMLEWSHDWILRLPEKR